MCISDAIQGSPDPKTGFCMIPVLYNEYYI